ALEDDAGEGVFGEMRKKLKESEENPKKATLSPFLCLRRHRKVSSSSAAKDLGGRRMKDSYGSTVLKQSPTDFFPSFHSKNKFSKNYCKKHRHAI
ncbi:MAG: hypothetical protein IKA76_07235, partial [Clostridia bacterium]|nr:hypothetical protein [Clostridia bacterium]